MAKFQVEWDDGKVEVVEQSDCSTLEQYLNCRFGAGKEIPAKVVQLDGIESVKEEPKAKKSAKKAASE
jgi:hypothetical protein